MGHQLGNQLNPFGHQLDGEEANPSEVALVLRTVPVRRMRVYLALITERGRDRSLKLAETLDFNVVDEIPAT